MALSKIRGFKSQIIQKDYILTKGRSLSLPRTTGEEIWKEQEMTIPLRRKVKRDRVRNHLRLFPRITMKL